MSDQKPSYGVAINSVANARPSWYMSIWYRLQILWQKIKYTFVNPEWMETVEVQPTMYEIVVNGKPALWLEVNNGKVILKPLWNMRIGIRKLCLNDVFSPLSPTPNAPQA